MPGHLQDEVGGSAEPGEPEALASSIPASPERAVADCAGAQERGGLRIGVDSGDGIGEVLRNGHVLGVPAVDIPTGRF